MITVLVVDDDTLVAASTRRVLESAGCEVVCAFTSVQALALLDCLRFDVVLTDQHLEGAASGLSVLMRCFAVSPRTVRLLTSGRRTGDVNGALSSGLLHGFLQKPVESARMIDAVRGHGP